MSVITPLMPRQPVPDLDVPVLSGGRFVLADQRPDAFTLVVFYRGYHCPVCAKYMRELDRLHGEYTSRGVGVVAVSSDTRERAQLAHDAWHLENLDLAYGLDLDAARRWGLYISSSKGKTSIGVEEPALFSEPGVFLVRPDGRLYYGAVQTMPFARPHFDDLLQAVDFALTKDYPARGEVVDHHHPTPHPEPR